MKTSEAVKTQATKMLELSKRLEELETVMDNMETVVSSFFPKPEEPKEEKKGIMGVIRAEKMKEVPAGNGVGKTDVQEYKVS